MFSHMGGELGIFPSSRAYMGSKDLRLLDEIQCHGLQLHGPRSQRQYQEENPRSTGSREKRVHLFYIQNPALPKLYGTIKTHKAGYPIRPVVAYFTDLPLNSLNVSLNGFEQRVALPLSIRLKIP